MAPDDSISGAKLWKPSPQALLLLVVEGVFVLELALVDVLLVPEVLLVAEPVPLEPDPVPFAVDPLPLLFPLLLDC